MCVLEIQDVHPMRKHLDFLYGATRWPPSQDNKFKWGLLWEISFKTYVYESTEPLKRKVLYSFMLIRSQVITNTAGKVWYFCERIVQIDIIINMWNYFCFIWASKFAFGLLNSTTQEVRMACGSKSFSRRLKIYYIWNCIDLEI